MAHRTDNVIAFWNSDGYSIETAGGEKIIEFTAEDGAHRLVIRNMARTAGRKIALTRGVRFVGAQYKRGKL